MKLRQPRVAVLGSGSWGTTVASIVARSAATRIWARSPEVASEINESHTTISERRSWTGSPERSPSRTAEAHSQAG